MLRFGRGRDFIHATNASVTKTIWPQPTIRRPAGRSPSSTTIEMAAPFSRNTVHSCRTVASTTAPPRYWKKAVVVERLEVR